MLTPEQIEKLVAEKYPIHPREHFCFNTKERLEFLRAAYRKRLQEGEPKVDHSDN